MNIDDIPVFITETGWNAPGISEEAKAEYYSQAFSTVWADPGIVSITPFLFNAGDGPFKGFSFFSPDGKPKDQMNAILKMPKIAGKPVATPFVLGLEKEITPNSPLRNFSNQTEISEKYSLSIIAQQSFKWVFKL